MLRVFNMSSEKYSERQDGSPDRQYESTEEAAQSYEEIFGLDATGRRFFGDRITMERAHPHFLHGYDELHSKGELRAQYRMLEKNLSALGASRLSAVLDEMQRLNAHYRPLFSLRHDAKLKVDPIPVCITKSEFATLKAGMRQRANAFNKFLDDVYNGKQDIVPKDIIKASPYYFPECEGIALPKKCAIFMYAPDLLRIGEDDYFVYDENLKLPSGLGFAIRARELREEYIPELLDGIEAMKFDDYPRLRDALSQLSFHSRKKSKLAVMLSDGYKSYGYHDNRYLANRLGIALAEPRDIKIDADGLAMLKTIDGEKEIDVILRRVSDPDLYVPGVSQSYVNNRVNLQNSLGAGILDDKALYQYYDEIVRQYSGKEPIIKTLETMTIESRDVRRKLLSEIDIYTIRKRESSVWMRAGADLSDDEVRVLANELTADPETYVLQRSQPPSIHRNIDTSSLSNPLAYHNRKPSHKQKEFRTRARSEHAHSRTISLSGGDGCGTTRTRILIRPYAFCVEGAFETIPVGLVKCAANGSTFGSIFDCTLKDIIVEK